jgi:hypothetical protein
MVATYEENLGCLLDDIQKMLRAKHHDYGVDNLKKRGLLGIMVRLDDKMARIDNLSNNQNTDKQPQVDEKISDTLMDIAGYAIQAILLLENKL